MTPQEQQEARGLMREVLQDDLLVLSVESYRLDEALCDARCDIVISVRNAQTGEAFSIEGSGVGLVDAAFQATKQRYVAEHPSLESLSFTAFEVKGLMQSGHDSASDAEAVVEIGVKNSYGVDFTFEARSRSVGNACICGVIEALTYFINSERAFVRMYKARQHYEKAGRGDLVSKYTKLMAQMVANTSYSEVIERIRAEAELK